MSAFLLGLVLSFALNWVSTENPYFPVKTKAGDQGISKFEAEWYTKPLERMKEPHLFGQADDSKEEAYRILILPTWGNAICVRAEKHGQVYSLSARRLSGQAGFELGKLVETRDVELAANDSKTLDVLIQNLKFFEMPTDDDVRGFDGDEWILEGVSNGKYHIAQRWCATEYGPDKRKLTAFLALFKFMLDKSTLSQRPSNKGHKLI
jgi:hypothetical protein